MTPAFIDPATHHRWHDYFAEVDRLLAQAGGDATSLREELRAHVLDSIATNPGGENELDQLETALDRLGQPIDYLRPLLANGLIDRGTRRYNPLTIGRGLFHTVLIGSRRAILALAFSIGYLLLAVLTTIAVLKPFWWKHVGLFRHTDGAMSFGIVGQTTGAHEILGAWTIPIALALAAVLYIALTKGLRALHNRW